MVQVFFGSHDPTTLNRQGPDRGTQYRSIAFYKNEEEKNSVEEAVAALFQVDRRGITESEYRKVIALIEKAREEERKK